MIEEWKPIKGYEGFYEVSNTGKVRSVNRELVKPNGISYHYKSVVLKQRDNGNGYLIVCLRKRCSHKNKYIHRLVAEAFIPNPENKSEINHKDGNKTNNVISNLEWCTRSQNAQHGFDNGLLKKGENHYAHIFTEKEVKYIKENCIKYDANLGINALARKFNVSQGAIAAIVNNKTWKGV